MKTGFVLLRQRLDTHSKLKIFLPQSPENWGYWDYMLGMLTFGSLVKSILLCNKILIWKAC